MAADPVVARHYRGFRVEAARIMPSTEQLVYVSYRIGGAVYWTAHRVRLPRGEPLLFDGEHRVRARCGNRISSGKMSPTQRNAVAEDALDSPEQPVAGPPLSPSATALVAELFPCMAPPLPGCGASNAGPGNGQEARPDVALRIGVGIPGVPLAILKAATPLVPQTNAQPGSPALEPLDAVTIRSGSVAGTARTVPAAIESRLSGHRTDAVAGTPMALWIGMHQSSEGAAIPYVPISDPPAAPPPGTWTDLGRAGLPAAPDSSEAQLPEANSLFLVAVGSAALALGMRRSR